MASSATLPSASVVASSSALPMPANDIVARSAVSTPSSLPSQASAAAAAPRFQPLLPIRNYIDSIAVEDEGFARLLYQLIPGQCPFERDVVLFGRTVAHIPPLCKLNPFYEQVVGLRFRAMCYLVDECGVAL